MFEREHLKLGISERPYGSQYYLYLSRSGKLIERAKGADNSFGYQGMSSDRMSRSIRGFGALLGYPRCCTDFFVDNGHLPGRELPYKFIPDKGIDFRFNNLLNGVSNHYLSFHQPCSYSCPASGDYLKRIYNAIGREDPGFRNELDLYLKAPYLVVFNLNLKLNNAWDTRRGFYFDGKVDQNAILYRESIFFRTTYPEYDNKATDRSMEDLKEAIAQGNRIVCGEDSISVYRDRELLDRFEKRDSFYISLFDFT